MMFALDTNILIYAHFDEYPQHKKARAFLRRCLTQNEDWCLGWQVVYEYIRLVTHPAVHKRPITVAEAIADLKPYLASSQCHLLSHTPLHLQVLEAVVTPLPAAKGNFLHDCHYAALLKENSVKRIYTADADFRKFEFLEVIDPTA